VGRHLVRRRSEASASSVSSPSAGRRSTRTRGGCVRARDEAIALPVHRHLPECTGFFKGLPENLCHATLGASTHARWNQEPDRTYYPCVCLCGGILCAGNPRTTTSRAPAPPSPCSPCKPATRSRPSRRRRRPASRSAATSRREPARPPRPSRARAIKKTSPGKLGRGQGQCSQSHYGRERVTSGRSIVLPGSAVKSWPRNRYGAPGIRETMVTRPEASVRNPRIRCGSRFT
jgi:hypothetical protein